MQRLFSASLFLFACVFSYSRVEADPWQKWQDRGAELYYADADLREAFHKANPQTLPTFGKKIPAVDAPAFDWSTLLPPAEIKNQNPSANCWAFAATTVFEYAWRIRNGALPGPLAVQPIVDRLGKDGFGTAEEAFAELLANGTCLSRLYPGDGKPGKLRSNIATPYRAISYGRVQPAAGPVDRTLIKQALLDHGPVTSLIQLTPRLKAHREGVFNEHFKPKAEAPPSTHIVVIVGWDDRRGREGCWKIQNSWGPKWTEGGFTWIEYDCNEIGNCCVWVRAQSSHYQLPKNAHTRVPGKIAPFTNWPKAAQLDVKAPELETSTVAEAVKQVGDRVRVKFTVAGWAIPNDKSRLDLYSEKSWRDKGCLTLRIRKEDVAKFKANDLDEVLQKMRAEGFIVTGSAQTNPTEVGERPVIELYDPAQFEPLK